MRDYHDLWCCPMCGNTSVLRRVWQYVNDTAETTEDDNGNEAYKCPDCGDIKAPIPTEIFVEDKIKGLFDEGKVFIYEQPDGTCWCAFNDYPLLKRVYANGTVKGDLCRLYDDGSEAMILSDQDLNDAISQNGLVGLMISIKANFPRYYIPAIAEVLYPIFLSE